MTFNEYTGLAPNSKGGTESIAKILQENLPKDLFNKHQIIFSRVGKFEKGKKRILYLHDMVEDPANNHLLNKVNWTNFDLFVFVSYSQRNEYITKFNIPYSKCMVIHNCVKPYENVTDTDKFQTAKNGLKLIYHTTPHRGLEILYVVFDYLVKNDPNFKNATLDVFSSFEIYGWNERDEQYKELFDSLRNHENIKYHGYQDNSVVREALNQSHIFAYPNIWKETSCIAGMEAMYHNNIVLCPDLGALPETTGRFAYIYPYLEEPQSHAQSFLNVLRIAGEHCVNKPDNVIPLVSRAKEYCDFNYSQNKFIQTWTTLLNNM